LLNVIAVDIGASNGRVMVGGFDGSKLEVHEAGRFPNTPVHLAGGLFWNVLSLYDSIRDIIGRCYRQGLEPSAIAFDTWAQDFGLIGNGILLSNPRHYRDPYTDGQVFKAGNKMAPGALFDIVATHPFQGSAFYQLMAMREKYSGLLDHADHLLFMPNLFTYLTCGLVSCDCTIASFSQMYDISQKKWSSDILARFDLPDILPSAQNPGQIIGKTDQEFNEETGYSGLNVVLAAGHDTASAAYTMLGRNDSPLVVSSGTWSMFVANVERPVTSFRDSGMNFTNALGADGKHILVRGLTGLWILQQCMKQWKTNGLVLIFAELERYALEHVCDVWFDVDDPELAQTQNMLQTVADLCIKNGFTSPGSPYEYYTVIMHSLARKYEQVFLEFEAVTGKPHKNICIIGGGAKDPVLRSLTSYYSNRKVITGPCEATALGNILLQLIALGEIRLNQVSDIVAAYQE
jgi:rhamnulokinase